MNKENNDSARALYISSRKPELFYDKNYFV